VDEGLLAELMRNPYYRPCPPKSAGRDEFGASELDGIQARAGETPWAGDDLAATVMALTARSIAQACRRFIMPVGRVDQLIAAAGARETRR
jgi:anhydro-N-acetylmuramic acid kinase